MSLLNLFRSAIHSLQLSSAEPEQVGKCAVFIDTDNCFGAINNSNPELARLFLQQPQQMETFIRQQLNLAAITFHYYGNRHFLMARGLSPDHPIRTADRPVSGKNSDDIQIALDIARLDTSVNRVVIVSSDSDFIPVARWCRQQWKQVFMFPFGPINPQNRGEFDAIWNSNSFIDTLIPLIDVDATSAGSGHITPISGLLQLTAPQKIAVCHFLRDLLQSHNGSLHLAQIGQALRNRFNLHHHHWYGYGSCKQICLQLIEAARLDSSGYYLQLK